MIVKLSTRSAAVSGKPYRKIEKKLSDAKYPLQYFECNFSSDFVYPAPASSR